MVCCSECDLAVERNQMHHQPFICRGKPPAAQRDWINGFQDAQRWNLGAYSQMDEQRADVGWSSAGIKYRGQADPSGVLGTEVSSGAQSGVIQTWGSWGRVLNIKIAQSKNKVSAWKVSARKGQRKADILSVAKTKGNPWRHLKLSFFPTPWNSLGTAKLSFMVKSCKRMMIH